MCSEWWITWANNRETEKRKREREHRLDFEVEELRYINGASHTVHSSLVLPFLWVLDEMSVYYEVW